MLEFWIETPQFQFDDAEINVDFEFEYYKKIAKT